MADVDQGLIEKYQNMLLKDPASKVFAPLSEAYRRLGWLEEARAACVQGLSHNPDFGSGYVALAKVELDGQHYEAAAESLKKAVELSPENLLAYQLLADCYLHLGQAKEALKSFKMVLFLNPESEKALRAVKRLESLTADEYEEELFSMQPLGRAAERLESDEAPLLEPVTSSESKTTDSKTLERFLSLSDAFIVRNDLDKALETLEQARYSFGEHKAVVQRIRLIQQRILNEEDDPPKEETKISHDAPAMSREDLALQAKIEFLEKLLVKISRYQAPIPPS